MCYQGCSKTLPECVLDSVFSIAVFCAKQFGSCFKLALIDTSNDVRVNLILTVACQVSHSNQASKYYAHFYMSSKWQRLTLAQYTIKSPIVRYMNVCQDIFTGNSCYSDVVNACEMLSAIWVSLSCLGTIFVVCCVNCAGYILRGTRQSVNTCIVTKELILTNSYCIRLYSLKFTNANVCISIFILHCTT